MSMYGNRLVKHEALKRWVKTISLDNINSVDIGGELFELTEESKKILGIQIALFSKLVELVKDIEQNRCAMACQGCGIAIFCFL